MVGILRGRGADHFEGKDITLVPYRDGFNFSAGHGSYWAEHRVARINFNRWSARKPKWTRAELAIILLERVPTPEAIAILCEMTTGHPNCAADEGRARRTGEDRCAFEILISTMISFADQGLSLKIRMSSGAKLQYGI